MTAILNQSDKQKVKEHLKRISNMLQYLSFETIEKMLYEMKTLKVSKLQNEFLMLTHFHGQKVEAKIKLMEIDDEIKQKMMDQINLSQKDLFEMANYDPESLRNNGDSWIHDAYNQGVTPSTAS